MLVIDRLGSMAGRRLAEVRRSAEYVTSTLRPTDSVSLVRFDNRVQRLWPAVPLCDRRTLRAALAGMQPGCNTHLHGGWHEGAQWAARGVTTITYGLGAQFNEGLMVAMAQAGGGNHCCGDTADDLMEPFRQELELFGNLCLRDLRLSITKPDGLPATMVNDLPRDERGGRLPDLPWGAEAWAVVRVEVPAGAVPAAGPTVPVLAVSVAAVDLDGAPVQPEKTRLALPVLSAGQLDVLTDDELATRRLEEVAAANALTYIRQAAAQQDWDGVDALLAQAHVQCAEHEWVAAVPSSMAAIALSPSAQKTMKEALYSST